MTDTVITCVKGHTITDALSRTKREGKPSSPVAWLALKLLRYFKILLFSGTIENAYDMTEKLLTET